ncbi:hypothetical protein EV426DRAFT_704496 [Tirmania nivea]|nr:hypothetical protein EV426DRAFT_704496 [Tirmania nivea]
MAIKLGGLLEEEYRLCYTDGTGKNGHHAAAFYADGNPPMSGHSYLGTESTVADAKHQGLVLALKANSEASMAPRSGIEVDLAAALKERHDRFYDTTISWVRAHVGITANENADKAADFHTSLAAHLWEVDQNR